MDNLEKFGTDLRSFLLGLMSETTSTPVDTPPEDNLSSWNQQSRQQSRSSALTKPDPGKIVFLSNVSARLKSGNLLLTVQKSNSIYRYDPETSETEVVCSFGNTPMFLWQAIASSSGEIYCCFSGSRRSEDPSKTLFGQGGALLRVKPQDEMMSLISGGNELQDPVHMILLGNSNLLILDFQGFGGTSALYELNPSTGARRTIASGGSLLDARSATITADGTIYIANPTQQYEFTKEPNGEWLKDSGSIVRIDSKTGVMSVIYDEFSKPRGAICGVVASADSRYLAITRLDWPSMSTSAVLRFDIEKQLIATIVEASVESPRFFSSAPAITDKGLLYVADSYQKELFKIDIENKSVVSKQSLTHVLGSTIGMVHSFETLEAIAIIP